MNKLKRITRQGEHFVAQALRMGDDPRLPNEPAFAEPAGIVTFDVELAATRIRSAVASLSGTAVDKELVKVLPDALPLGRRTAADPKMWAWIATALLPDVVIARFEESSRTTLTPRYLGRNSENALARCWWLSARCQDAKAAETLVTTQYLMERVLDWQLCASPQVTQAVVDVFGGVTDAVLIAQTLKRIGFAATALHLDAMTRAEVAALIRSEALVVQDAFSTRTRLA